MPNSRICISIMAFLSGFMMIWLLISWTALGPANVTTVGSFRLVYFACVFFVFVYFWIYFFRRPRGSKTLLDGRTALSGSAFIVGVAIGYGCIELGLIASRTTAEAAAGGFAVFVGLTMLPIVAWLALYTVTMFRRKAALRSEAES